MNRFRPNLKYWVFLAFCRSGHAEVLFRLPCGVEGGGPDPACCCCAELTSFIRAEGRTVNYHRSRSGQYR